MSRKISFSAFNLKYLLYSISLLIVDIILYLFIFNDKDKNIKVKHKLLDISCYFFGFLLNIIPECIFNKNPDKGNLSKKDIIKITIICFFLLNYKLAKKFINKKNIDDNNEQENLRDEYENYFLFIEFFIIYIIPHPSEVYYKHQKLSFFIFSLAEIIKAILFLIEEQFQALINIVTILPEIVYSITFAIYLIYIKELMKFRFVSPYKINFIVGMFNFPLTIIIYIIISFTPLGNEENYFYVDNIIRIYKDLDECCRIIKLILLPLAYGIKVLFINKIIYDFKLYHIYIPILLEEFIINISIRIKKIIIYRFIFIVFYLF